jgi:XRE family transcriptional regulator, aerobic/anaerobic benzoate catabolism transcriptional regulator
LTDSLGESLRDLRASRGLSRRALARILGLSDTYLAHVEGGYLLPSEARCQQLAAALNAAADDLLAAAGVIPAEVRQKLCAEPARFAEVRAL